MTSWDPLARAAVIWAVACVQSNAENETVTFGATVLKLSMYACCNCGSFAANGPLYSFTVPLNFVASVAHGWLEVVDDPPPAHAASSPPMAVIDSPAAVARSTKSLREIFPVSNDWMTSPTGSLAILSSCHFLR